MGQLIIDSGRRDLAERIRDEDNTGYLLELEVEGLSGWVATSGFTPTELATIQPSYGPARSDDTWIVQTNLEGENPELIKVARRPWWGASRSEVTSAVQFAGTIFYVDSYTDTGVPGAIQRVNGESRSMEGEGSLALAVADGKLFSLENTGVTVRGETGAWTQATPVPEWPIAFQVRSASDLWVLTQTNEAVTVSRFDGTALEPVVSMPRGNGVSDFFATTDGRVFFIRDGLHVGTQSQPATQVLPGATRVFGAGDQVFAIRGSAVFAVNAKNEAAQIFDGLPTLTGVSSRGVVLRDGRVAVVGPEGFLALRSVSGEWQKKALGATKARFADITEGQTGLVMTVAGNACVTKDWLCDEAPKKTGCSAVGGSSLVALLVAAGTLGRRRNSQRA